MTRSVEATARRPELLPMCNAACNLIPHAQRHRRNLMLHAQQQARSSWRRPTRFSPLRRWRRHRPCNQLAGAKGRKLMREPTDEKEPWWRDVNWGMAFLLMLALPFVGPDLMGMYLMLM